MHLRGNAVRLQQALDEMSFCRVLSDEDLFHVSLPESLTWYACERPFVSSEA